MAFLVHKMPLAIEWAHCDPAGIVWNPRFFEFFDTAAWRLFEQALGVPRAEINKRYGLIGLALVDAGANFTLPLRFGDTAELVSTIGEFRRSSFTVSHRVLKDGKLAVDGLETRVWAVPDASDPERMRTAPVPPEVIDRFRV